MHMQPQPMGTSFRQRTHEPQWVNMALDVQGVPVHTDEEGPVGSVHVATVGNSGYPLPQLDTAHPMACSDPTQPDARLKPNNDAAPSVSLRLMTQLLLWNEVQRIDVSGGASRRRPRIPPFPTVYLSLSLVNPFA